MVLLRRVIRVGEERELLLIQALQPSFRFTDIIWQLILLFPFTMESKILGCASNSLLRSFDFLLELITMVVVLVTERKVV